MKLSPPNLRAPKASPQSDDALGRGMDAALTVALFFGIGFGLDHWLGTTPWFMIGLTLLAGVGFFLSFKYRYDARMTELEELRRARAARGKVKR
jgi:F0F1-type ATP synthase assembly protein I